jgi:hypothetical protein
MRKQIRRPVSSSRPPKKRVLLLTQETVRTLTSEELSQVATGCPTGTDTEATRRGSLTC